MSARLSELERLRMCLAEAGFNPSDARFNPRTGFCEYRAGAVPESVAWRARELCTVDEPVCRACFAVGVRGEATPCAAGRRLVYDCGVSR